jgi:hypothetical protein
VEVVRLGDWIFEPPCPVHYDPSIGGHGALIGTVRLSRPHLWRPPGHLIVTAAFQPYHNDAMPIPLQGRAGRIVGSGCQSKEDCNPRGGGGWPCMIS